MSYQVMSLEEAIAKVPAINAEAPAECVSKRYSFLPSKRIIQDMSQLGWGLVNVKGIKSGTKNKYRKEHGKHFLMFENPAVRINNDKGVEANVQIIFKNDSMGTTRLRINVGLMRLVCENGLVIAEKSLGNYALRHMKYEYKHLQELVTNIVNDLPKAVAKVQTFSDTILTPEQMSSFANEALKLRANEERVATPEEIADILKPRREADKGNSLWLVFNRVQESIIRGGTTYIDAKGKLRKMKPINNIMVAPKINEELWSLAEQYC